MLLLDVRKVVELCIYLHVFDESEDYVESKICSFVSNCDILICCFCSALFVCDHGSRKLGCFSVFSKVRFIVSGCRG